MFHQFDPPKREDRFRSLLERGKRAIHEGDFNAARVALLQAGQLHPDDAQPYLWLSATTEDVAERREYLEQAVVRDPSNAAARQGLAILNGKLDPARILPSGTGAVVTSGGEEAATAYAFHCPQCGGQLAFEIETQRLTCAHCGVSAPLPAAGASAESTEQVLDFVMPTIQGHQWAQTFTRLECGSCGAHNLLSPEQKTGRCPYCGANQWIEAANWTELLEPQCIGPMQLTLEQVKERVQQWLGRGLFTPDDLVKAIGRMRLRPAYYSCWTFDGLLKLPWTCEVEEGSDHWVPLSGVEERFFDDVLVPGVKSLQPRELESLEPFPLKELVPFSPDYLAGWNTLIYDIALADASLVARERVLRKIRPQLHDFAAPGRQKRRLQAGGGNWSGMTYKHVLLPIWVGSYSYRQQTYRLLVNGITGKVGGKKPSDSIKVVLFGLIVLFGLTLIGLLLYFGFLYLSNAGMI
jgi:DNA-directed RNA polymerase subunit RPC12/RpoP